jgi:hypothetical protein
MGKILSVRSVLGAQTDIIMALQTDSLSDIGNMVREQIGELDGVMKTTTLLCSPADPGCLENAEIQPSAYVLIETRPGRSMARMVEQLRQIKF